MASIRQTRAKPVSGATPAQGKSAAPRAKSAPVSSGAITGLVGRAELAGVFAGKTILSTTHTRSGEAVRTVQRALIQLAEAEGKPALDLPRYGADGEFGPETRRAVKAFQATHGVAVDGEVGPKTIAALHAALAKTGGATGSRGVKYPEYDQMFKDGVLTTTLAIGYDEDGSDLRERKEALDGLANRGFRKLDVKGLGAEGLKQLGLSPSQVSASGSYYFKELERNGKPVKVLVRYVDRYTPGHRDEFAKGFAHDDLVLYGGHARYGSGPDFDTKKSTRGNFVIGRAYDAHMRDLLKNKRNDLAAAKLTKGYQMMFFSGCRTKDYFDDLRSKAKGKSASNLDFIGSDDLLYWDRTTENVFTVFDSVLAGKSANEMTSSLKKKNGNVGFSSDGFTGNRYRA